MTQFKSKDFLFNFVVTNYNIAYQNNLCFELFTGYSLLSNIYTHLIAVKQGAEIN